MGAGCLRPRADGTDPQPGSSVARTSTEKASSAGPVSTDEPDTSVTDFEDHDEPDVPFAAAEVENDRAEIPPFFADMLEDLDGHRDALGGLGHFKKWPPYIAKKVKQRDLTASYTDYEYVYLTILGFGKLHVYCEDIVRKNNGKVYTANPGVQMLESVAGFTMHGNRVGANYVLRSAAPLIVEAYEVAKLAHVGGSALDFFKGGFDRASEPCLEGRVGRLMGFLEQLRSSSEAGEHSAEQQVGPPWEEVSLRPLSADTPPMDVVGEHLRVFMGECLWRWARQRSLSFAEAKELRDSDEAAREDFHRLYSATEFENWMLARGAAAGTTEGKWESLENNTNWIAYEPDVNLRIEKAYRRGWPRIEVRLGAKRMPFEINLVKMVQRCEKSGRQRNLRRCEVPGVALPGRLSKEDLDAGIEYMIELVTIPRGSWMATATAGPATCGSGTEPDEVPAGGTADADPLSGGEVCPGGGEAAAQDSSATAGSVETGADADETQASQPTDPTIAVEDAQDPPAAVGKLDEEQPADQTTAAEVAQDPSAPAEQAAEEKPAPETVDPSVDGQTTELQGRDGEQEPAE